jgi:tetratricopeptide (TPR) repeat protein
MVRTFPDYEVLNGVFTKFQARDWEGGLKIARYLVARDPNNADFLQALGTALSRMRLTDSALVCYDRMIKLRPFSANYRVEKSQILYYSNRYPEAREVIAGAVALEPSSELVQEYLSRILLSLEFTDSAKAIADSIVEQNGNSATGTLLKLLYFDQIGQADSARAYFMRYRALGRNHYEYGSVLSKYKSVYY